MPAPAPFARRALWLPLLWMVLAIAAVASVAFIDQDREATRALADFGEEQHALAQALLTAAVPGAGAELHARGLLSRLQTPPGHRRLLVLLPGAAGLVDLQGQPVECPPVLRGLAEGRSHVLLSREESASLGMARRTSAVGLARALLEPEDPPGAGRREVALALVTGAERDRDRARRGKWRVLVTIGVAVLLVGTFGGAALQRQRQELTLAHGLAVAEAARARDERLNRLDRSAVMLTLAAGLAHEIGTPLAVIQGRAEQLGARPGLDERAASSLQTIAAQVVHIQEVVQGFLHLARGGTLSLESVLPLTVLRSAQALVEHRFEASGVRLQVPPPPDAPPIRCNRLLLEHALTNLLLNARDACGAGGTVELLLEPGPGKLWLVVNDDGEGIPPALASRVTEAFFSTKPEGKGTGLGLAIATEIAKLHHGTLALTPRAPRGTRAAIEIPLTEGPDHV